MKLHVRLALPLFAIAVGVMAAGTVGVIVLVQSTFGVAMEESGRQLIQIAENVLEGRARRLSAGAEKLAAASGSFAANARAVRQVRIDGAALVAAGTGRAPEKYGLSLDPADLKGMPDDLPSLLFVRAKGRLLVAGAARNGKRLVVAGQSLDAVFAAAMKELLRADIAIETEGESVASTLEGKDGAGPFHPVALPIHTPGGATAKITIFIPARSVYAARRTALSWTIAGGVVLLGVALLFYGYTVMRVTKPIRDLIAATERIGGGDLEAKLPAGAPAELGALMAQFNTMAAKLKEAQGRLVHSAKLSSVGSLVAGVSHELNNPLLGLLGHAEYLSSKINPGEPGREELDVIMQEGKRMKRILADLRGFLRPDGGNRAETDLNSIAGEVLSLIRHEAAKAGVECSSEFEQGGISVRAVADQVRQAVLNMALNALQAMTEGGRLVIGTSTELRDGKKFARVTVGDTGPGISPDELARVTEPFFSTKPGRMGLGLAICQEVATSHGGALTVDSQPGQGTRVSLQILEDNQ